jgi:hypothetical protein
MLVRRLQPIGVPLRTRNVRDLQRLCQMLDHGPWHRERVLQEQPDVPHRAHLQGEPEPIVVTTPPGDQRPVEATSTTNWDAGHGFELVS